jgi:hypothetical protein
MNELDKISWKYEVYLSDTMQSDYKTFLEGEDGNSRFIFDDIDDLFSKIVNDYPDLSQFQIKNLVMIFERFDKIRQLIDPNRLKSFDYYVNEDDNELLLFRDTSQYVVNLIIHQEDDITFSVISKSNSNDDKLHFLENESEIGGIFYSFFSY